MANKQSHGSKSLATNSTPKALILFHFFGALQAVLILVVAVSTLYLRRLEGDTAVGANLVFGLLFGLLALVASILALVVLIGLPIYMKRHKPLYSWPKQSTLTMVVSILTLSFLLWSSFGPHQETDYERWYEKHRIESRERAEQAEQNTQNEYLNSTVGKEITKEEAVALFNNCQVHEFLYENQRKRYSGEWGELSSTGIVTTEIVGKASTREKVIMVNAVSVSDKLAAEMLLVARDAQKTCSGVEIYKNGVLQQ